MEETQEKESIFFPIVRHALQFMGSMLVAQGAVTADEMNTLSGVIVSLFAVGWAICRRKGVKVCQK